MSGKFLAGRPLVAIAGVAVLVLGAAGILAHGVGRAIGEARGMARENFQAGYDAGQKAQALAERAADAAAASEARRREAQRQEQIAAAIARANQDRDAALTAAAAARLRYGETNADFASCMALAYPDDLRVHRPFGLLDGAEEPGTDERDRRAREAAARVGA